MNPTLSVLPPVLQIALEAALDTQLIQAVALSGGMVNQAARVDTPNGPLFVKWNAPASPGLFATEAQGLRALQATHTLRVPQVLAWADREQVDSITAAALPYLALEFIETHAPIKPATFTQNFATGLASLHRNTVSPCGFGLLYNNYLGALPQPNTPHADWPTFYRECRLLPQIATARERGLLPPHREQLLMRVVEKLDSLLAGLPARPALLHGDLWSGNFLTVGEDVALIDPAVYYGEREIEMAFVELFGGFPDGFMDAYGEVYPLDAGYSYRRPLHQLYYLLAHLNHFGETYGSAVERICHWYGV